MVFDMTSIMSYVDQKEFIEVQKLISDMNNDGLIARFQGACLPSSEIIQAILHSRGIKSRIIECTALVVNSPNNGNTIEFIGFDSLIPLHPNEIDTHVIVLVESDIPFIIDASIGHKMGSYTYVIVAPLDTKSPEVIAEASFNKATVTYRIKKNLRYFNLHQKTIAERLELEKITQSKISKIYLILYFLIAFGSINMIANSIIIFLKIYT
jgi:predicted XRE-type DNA-binding protein